MMNKVLLVDVGARGGIDPRWKPFYQQIRVIAFEPDPLECEKLNARTYPYEIRFHAAALGSKNNQQTTLHLTRARGCSSTLLPNANLSREFAYADKMIVEGTLATTLMRMDAVLTEPPDILKVDTQGTELHVLQGAGNLLSETIAVELEVEFVEQYVSQPLFADVDQFMRAAGFSLRGLRRSYWRNRNAYRDAAGGQLIHGDALYLRKSRLDTPEGHIILAAYRQYDLLAALKADKFIPSRSPLTRAGSLLLGMLGTNRQIRGLVDRLRPPSASDWHDPDFY